MTRGGTTTFFSRVDHHTQTYQAATSASDADADPQPPGGIRVGGVEARRRSVSGAHGAASRAGRRRCATTSSDDPRRAWLMPRRSSSSVVRCTRSATDAAYACAHPGVEPHERRQGVRVGDVVGRPVAVDGRGVGVLDGDPEDLVLHVETAQQLVERRVELLVVGDDEQHEPAADVARRSSAAASRGCSGRRRGRSPRRRRAAAARGAPREPRRSCATVEPAVPRTSPTRSPWRWAR